MSIKSGFFSTIFIFNVFKVSAGKSFSVILELSIAKDQKRELSDYSGAIKGELKEKFKSEKKFVF